MSIYPNNKGYTIKIYPAGDEAGQRSIVVGVSDLRKPLNHSSMSAVGYTVPWAAGAGQTVGLHFSCIETPDSISLLRLDGDDRDVIDLPILYLSDLPKHRNIDQGSYLRIRESERQKTGRLKSLCFELFLTINDGVRTIFEADGFALILSKEDIILVQDGAELVRVPLVPCQTWLNVELKLRIDAIILDVVSYDILAPFSHSATCKPHSTISKISTMLLGTDAPHLMPCLNARYASIKLVADHGVFNWTFPTQLPNGPIIAEYDGEKVELELVNLPTFCVASSRWDGTTFDPRVSPLHYDAIHCHDDDMGALGWPASCQITIPEGFPSGIYAFSIACAGTTEDIVFFVTTKTATNPLVFIVPTATYLAYADEYLPDHLYEWKCFDRGHRLAQDNNFKSLYDYHSDLSGVSICSYQKPKATLRRDYRYPLGDCPHNLPVDLEFLKFCRRNGIGIDIVTDHDVHLGGLALLAPYDGALTGSHPEYLSVEMEHAYRCFAGLGGSIVYLGGNGFATAVAFKDDLLELRRSPLEAGRTWDAPVGEQAFAITNEPGGYLRSRGRGEFSLTGVAISLMGFGEGRPFKRTVESFEAKHAWLFDGVVSSTFGETGRVLGAAAGYEVDATDFRLGTSSDTHIVARADGFPSDFYHDPSRWYAGGEHEMLTRRCAEMTVRYLKTGGLIFSASSVAWLGSLPKNGEMNDVGRMTLNILNFVQRNTKLL